MAESKKSQKFDRNRNWCKAYRARSQRERNKAVRLLRHFKRYGNASAPAVHCYNNLPMMAKPRGMLTVSLTPAVGKKIAPRERMPPVRSARA